MCAEMGVIPQVVANRAANREDRAYDLSLGLGSSLSGGFEIRPERRGEGEVGSLGRAEGNWGSRGTSEGCTVGGGGDGSLVQDDMRGSLGGA